MDVQGFRLSILLSKHSEARLSNIAHFHPSSCKFRQGSDAGAVGKVSQETLAEMIGTTRGRVSFHEQILQFGMESV
jgi:hypothetical protein